jgi:2'-5' RNA ligase superfamily protein
MVARLLAVIAAVLLLSTPAVHPVNARADVEQAKATGGLIALYPRDADARVLAVPGGALQEELHITLVNLGEDVRDMSDVELRHRLDAVAASHPGPVEAQVFGHALLNPHDPERRPSTVYIVGDSPELVSVRQDVLAVSQELFDPLPQLEPWLPHITAAYSALESELKYTGPVAFDRIGLTWAGSTTYWQL